MATIYRRSLSKQAYSAWKTAILKQKIVEQDQITPSPVNLFDLTMQDLTGPQLTSKSNVSVLPFESRKYDLEFKPCRHFMLFPPRIPAQGLANDGYDKDWSPPLPFEFRMWAGGSLNFNHKNPLKVLEHVQQITKATQVEMKQTIRGDAIFVTVEKEISNETGLSIVETRTLVYLENRPSESRLVKRNTKPDFTLKVSPTTVSLFRFSALTFNSHLIHYDLEYCKDEGYPRPLVHGPLTATLLLDFFKMSVTCGPIISFTYRAISPLVVGDTIVLKGKLSLEPGSCELWATSSEGGIAMSGTVKFIHL